MIFMTSQANKNVIQSYQFDLVALEFLEFEFVLWEVVSLMNHHHWNQQLVDFD